MRIRRKRKRSSPDPLSPSKELTALSYSSNDLRASVEKLQSMTKRLHAVCVERILPKLERLDKYTHLFCNGSTPSC